MFKRFMKFTDNYLLLLTLHGFEKAVTFRHKSRERNCVLLVLREIRIAKVTVKRINSKISPSSLYPEQQKQQQNTTNNKTAAQTATSDQNAANSCPTCVYNNNEHDKDECDDGNDYH